MARKPASPLCYSYARFSSKQQAKGDSLRRQAEARDAWLARMGLTLDESLVMTDEGVSAFRGGNQDNPDRNALAAFLELVKGGKVPRGSYLLCESLDRLSREHIRPALTLLLNLIDAGVRVVQLIPVEAVYDEKVEPMMLMQAIMELSRGNSESAVKSDRVGKAWARKKADAATTRKPITRECPAWLAIENGKYVVLPGAADAIKFVYRLAAEGAGFKTIMRRLEKDRVKPLGELTHWARSTVAKLLASRRVVGEYQPFVGSGHKNRKPDGPPIPNFYPAVISEDEWNAARFALDGRRMHRGPVGKREYLFAGLLKDARDGSAIYRTDKGPNGGGAKLVNSNAMEGKGTEGAKYVTFPAGIFEREVLRRLREIDPQEVLPGGGGGELDKLRTRHANLSSRIERIRGQMVDGDEDVGPLVSAMRDLQGKLDAVASDLSHAEQQAATPLASAWDEYRTLADVLEKSPDKKATRGRLRSAVRRIVEDVHCLFLGSGMTRYAAVQVSFRGGNVRTYLIRHTAKHGRSGTPASTESKSLAEAGLPADRDLRKPADAAVLEKLLARHAGV